MKCRLNYFSVDIKSKITYYTCGLSICFLICFLPFIFEGLKASDVLAPVEVRLKQFANGTYFGLFDCMVSGPWILSIVYTTTPVPSLWLSTVTSQKSKLSFVFEKSNFGVLGNHVP